MKTVVITGSTRGIGRGLADAFLARRCNVVISGRKAADVAVVVAKLDKRYPGKVTGAACDVTRFEQLQGLWDAAIKKFGKVDVWINNAGISIHRGPLAEAKPTDIEAIVATNLTGSILATRLVVAEMLKQGSGQVWNMEGFGSQGSVQPGMAAYGSTKRAINYFNKSMKKELGADCPVHVCTLSPGIVVTDLLMSDYDLKSDAWKRAKKFFNILGDSLETVTPWLAEKMLAADKQGARVIWLTTPKVLGRFLAAGFKKRDLFAHIPGA